MFKPDKTNGFEVQSEGTARAEAAKYKPKKMSAKARYVRMYVLYCAYVQYTCTYMRTVCTYLGRYLCTVCTYVCAIRTLVHAIFVTVMSIFHPGLKCRSMGTS